LSVHVEPVRGAPRSLFEGCQSLFSWLEMPSVGLSAFPRVSVGEERVCGALYRNRRSAVIRIGWGGHPLEPRPPSGRAPRFFPSERSPISSSFPFRTLHRGIVTQEEGGRLRLAAGLSWRQAQRQESIMPPPVVVTEAHDRRGYRGVSPSPSGPLSRAAMVREPARVVVGGVGVVGLCAASALFCLVLARRVREWLRRRVCRWRV
jgi:hypothetical protein